jgi:hypothetical protein
MAEIDTTYKDTGIVDEKPSPTSQSPSYYLGYSDGERWSSMDACRMEHEHFVKFICSDVGIAWKSSDAPCDRLAHELFFALLGIIGDGNAANNLDEANAFWQRFCPNALTSRGALQGFIEGALTVSDHAVRQFPYSNYASEQAWEDAAQDAAARHDVWLAGISWAFESATTPELDNVRAFVDGQDRDWPASDWKERLLAFSTFSRCERVYYAIAGGDKDKNAAYKFWAACCPGVLWQDGHVECFVLGVCFAMALREERENNTFPSIATLDRAIGRYMVWPKPMGPVNRQSGNGNGNITVAGIATSPSTSPIATGDPLVV